MLFHAFESFFEEFEKISASRERMSIPKSRSGRRSMSVSTLLRKENEGTLYNPTPHATGRVKVRDEADDVMYHRLNGEAEKTHHLAKVGAVIRASCGDEMEYKLRKAGLYRPEHEGKMQKRLARLADREPPGKLAAAQTEQANAVFQEVDPKNPTITPPVLLRRGDGPSRDDIPGKAIVENRGDMSGFTAAQGFAPNGYKDY
jgi:hypothetical protein